METLNGLLHYGQNLLNAVAQWTLDNPGILAAVIWGALTFSAAYGFLAWYNKPKETKVDREALWQRGMKLMAQRKAKLDAMYADMIGDMLFSLWCNGAISRQEYRRDSRRFGVKYKLLDLLPRRNHKEAVKARVQKNVKVMHDELIAMQVQLEKIRSGGFAVLEAKVKDMPQPSLLERRVKIYLARGKSLGLKKAS